jgi:hypothetical protein
MMYVHWRCGSLAVVVARRKLRREMWSRSEIGSRSEKKTSGPTDGRTEDARRAAAYVGAA